MPLYIKRIPDGSITTSKIADGAVTDAKISGRLSLSKLPTNSTANRVLAVRTVNADPVYDQIYTNDIKVKTDTVHHINTRQLAVSDLLFMPLILFYDAIRFLNPTVEVWNGSEWIVDNSGNANVLFRGLMATYTITNGSTNYHRFTFDLGVTYSGASIFVARVRHGGNNVYVKIEFSSDGSNWIIVLNTTLLTRYSGMSGGYYIIPLQNYPDTNSRYVRITITWEWISSPPQNITLNNIMLYTAGGDHILDNRRLPFSWNTNGSLIQRVNQSDIKFATHLNPETDNTYDIGSDTLRWKRVRAVTVSTGDIELANDWRITELDDGVVIKNKDGEEVFRITNDGLWFKGNKIA